VQTAAENHPVRAMRAKRTHPVVTGAPFTYPMDFTMSCDICEYQCVDTLSHQHSSTLEATTTWKGRLIHPERKVAASKLCDNKHVNQTQRGRNVEMSDLLH